MLGAHHAFSALDWGHRKLIVYFETTATQEDRNAVESALRASDIFTKTVAAR